MRAQSRARGWALQALYAWEMRGAAGAGPLAVLQELSEQLRISPGNRLFAEVLIRVVWREQPRIDRLLQDQLANWRLERLSAIDRNILRLGAAELLHVDEVPGRITVREMVRLAERYGTGESPRFINGVLDGVLRRITAEQPGEIR